MANDFSDASCKAVWRLEPDAVTTDSSGNGNTFTNLNSVAVDETNFQEGSGAALFSGAAKQALSIADANLCAGFPFKSGDTTLQGTFCFWVRRTGASITGYPSMFANCEWAGLGTCLFLGFRNSLPNLGMAWGYAGGLQNQELWENIASLSQDVWYHIAVIIDGPDKSVIIRIYNADTQEINNYTHTFSNALVLRGAPFKIGVDPTDIWNNFAGQTDEFVVFNRRLSNDEVDAIRTASFPPVTNNFLDDPNCKAVYRLEPGALTTDSQGSNTLTLSATPPTADKNVYHEGVSSALLNPASTQHLKLVSPAADFPLQTGDTDKLVTFCGWVRFNAHTNGTWRYIFGKTKYYFLNRQGVGLGGQGSASGHTLYVHWGTGTGGQDFNTGVTLVDNQWYHLAIVADGVNKSIKVRVWNGSTATNYTYTPNNQMGVGSQEFRIGYWNDNSGGSFAGNIDEVVVFDRLLSDDEIDDIRSGTFFIGVTGSFVATSGLTGEVSRTFAAAGSLSAPSGFFALATSGSEIGNDFTEDSSCQGLWRFEGSPGLAVDERRGQAFTLSETAPMLAPLHVEGATSLSFAAPYNTFGAIPDASLTANFPFRPSNEIKTGTICFWMANGATTPGVNNEIVNKGSTTDGWFFRINTSGVLQFDYRYLLNGTSWGWSTLTLFTPPPGVWYHVSIVIDGQGATDKRTFVAIYVYDSSSFTTTCYHMYPYDLKSVNSGLALGTSSFCIGNNVAGTAGYTGLLDELVVFNRCLSSIECMRIRKNCFPVSANKFTEDASCKAFYSGAYLNNTADSISTNTLTNGFETVGSSRRCAAVPSDGCLFIGDNSGGNESLYRNDADLSEGFPFKDGDTTKKLTFCLWYWTFVDDGAYHGYALTSKTANLNKGFEVKVGADNQLQILWGNGTSVEVFNTGIFFNKFKWYHIAVCLDSPAKSIYVRVYNQHDESVSTYSATASGYLEPDTGKLFIGSSTYDATYNHLGMDEILFFNRVLSPAEIDAIRSSAFGQTTIQEVTGSINITALLAGIHQSFHIDIRFLSAIAKIKSVAGMSSRAGFVLSPVASFGGNSVLSGTEQRLRGVSGSSTILSDLYGKFPVKYLATAGINATSTLNAVTGFIRPLHGNLGALSALNVLANTSRNANGTVVANLTALATLNNDGSIIGNLSSSAYLVANTFLGIKSIGGMAAHSNLYSSAGATQQVLGDIVAQSQAVGSPGLFFVVSGPVHATGDLIAAPSLLFRLAGSLIDQTVLSGLANAKYAADSVILGNFRMSAIMGRLYSLWGPLTGNSRLRAVPHEITDPMAGDLELVFEVYVGEILINDDENQELVFAVLDTGDILIYEEGNLIKLNEDKHNVKVFLGGLNNVI